MEIIMATHGGKTHALQLYRSDDDGGAGEAGNHGHCREDEVPDFV